MATFREILDSLYLRVARRPLAVITNSTREGIIPQRLDELEAEAQRLFDEGERLTPSNPVFRALIADLDGAMGRNAGVLEGVAGTLQEGGIATANLQGRDLIPDWTDPDPEALRRLIDYTQNEAWVGQVARYGDDVVNIVTNQAVVGVGRVKNPLLVARRVRQLTENLPTSTANNIMRTLFLESYRGSNAVGQNVNRRVISQVIRIASLDDRVCMACVALHGTVIWDSARNEGEPIPKIQEHHQGRCTTLPVPQGLSRNVESGETWFNGLSETDQRRVMNNNAAYEEWREGKIQLNEFIKPYTDDVFGAMIREASLKDIQRGR